MIREIHGGKQLRPRSLPTPYFVQCLTNVRPMLVQSKELDELCIKQMRLLLQTQPCLLLFRSHCLRKPLDSASPWRNGESKLGVNFPSKFLSKFSSSTYHAYRKYHCIKIHEIRGDKKWRQKRPHPENEVRPWLWVIASPLCGAWRVSLQKGG